VLFGEFILEASQAREKKTKKKVTTKRREKVE
jgi:hypothetical protein